MQVKLPPYVSLSTVFSKDQLKYLDWLLFQPLDGALKDGLPPAHKDNMQVFYKSLKVIVQDEIKR